MRAQFSRTAHLPATAILKVDAPSKTWLNELQIQQLSDVVQGDVMGEKAERTKISSISLY